MGSCSSKSKQPADQVSLGEGDERSPGVADDANNGAGAEVAPPRDPETPEVHKKREYSPYEKELYCGQTREYRRRTFYNDRLHMIKHPGDIPPWGDTGETLPTLEGPLQGPTSRQGRGAKASHPQYDPELNRRVSLIQDEGLFNLEVAAIVFPNYHTLQTTHSWEVFCIHTSAGPDLQYECNSLGGCGEGQAVVTGGYKLPADYVIHTVPAEDDNLEVLESCFQSCLELVRRRGFTTVAFPILCYPRNYLNTFGADFIGVGLRTLRTWMEQGKGGYLTNVDRIIFTVPNMGCYKELLQVYFPLKPDLPKSGADISEEDVDEGDVIAAHGSTPEREKC